MVLPRFSQPFWRDLVYAGYFEVFETDMTFQYPVCNDYYLGCRVKTFEVIGRIGFCIAPSLCFEEGFLESDRSFLHPCKNVVCRTVQYSTDASYAVACKTCIEGSQERFPYSDRAAATHPELLLLSKLHRGHTRSSRHAVCMESDNLHSTIDAA